MRNEFFYPSKDGITQIHAIEWLPEGKPIGVLQMCHGMVEHISRYDAFAKFLASNGFYVVGHDHLGHGQSMTSDDKKGYFAHPNGNAAVIGDIHQLRLTTQEKYPDIPYFMMGHSMGSFLLRQYLGLYSDRLSGAIIMGTGNQPSLILAGGMLICKVISMVKGWSYRSMFVDGMAGGSYEKKMGRGWLSQDKENQVEYEADPLCGFKFTVNAYYHMFAGMKQMNKFEKEGKAAKELPLFFVSGAEDPVGENGKGVELVVNRYKNAGYKNVKMKLYPKDRHEILNERDKEVVYQDILNFLRGN